MAKRPTRPPRQDNAAADAPRPRARRATRTTASAPDAPNDNRSVPMADPDGSAAADAILGGAAPHELTASSYDPSDTRDEARTEPTDVDRQSTSMGSEPSENDIRVRAYQRYLERGGRHGQDFDDWLEAERELKEGR